MGQKNVYQPHVSFIRVATACPIVHLGNVARNVEAIAELYAQAVAKEASLVVFPELSLVGYTLGDLLQQRIVLDHAQEGLLNLAALTKNQPTAMIVGLPFAIQNALYNCAAVLANGKVQGLVPKTFIPNHKEFYEKRWFQPWKQPHNIEASIGEGTILLGTNLLFTIGRAQFGIEICEDLWAADPPSVALAQAGAVIIANPSASPEQIFKSSYRRQLVTQQSARLVAGYIYAGCDASESTTDIVMSGHQLIAENGTLLAERPPLDANQRLSIADIDIDHLLNDRRKDTNFGNDFTMTTIDCSVTPQQTDLLMSPNPHPFVPKDEPILQNVFDIQAQSLTTRIRNTGVKKLVLGLSGGLDSTLALLVAAHSAKQLGIPLGTLLETITMPGAASSSSTQSNAAKLAKVFAVPNQTTSITKLANDQLAALSHDGKTQDITYENTQARLRTALLFNRANQVGGMVLGTGDLSEIALGWCTYNGDHMSHYNVNASVPKTLVRHLVAYVASQKEYANARPILLAILNTPISPELTKASADAVSQHTEDLIGPYELHDFFLYYLVRWNDAPDKILFLANQAFAGRYTAREVSKWFSVFLKRFMANQWKRSVAVDGPKVGSVSLSPRGDWRAPSDLGSFPS